MADIEEGEPSQRRMMLSRRELLQGTLTLPLLISAGESRASEIEQRSIVLGADGVLRWQSDGSELNLFGVNYGVASASAYRFLKLSGASALETIRRDLTHLRRLGANALRVPFWGDWENSDARGNLIENEHLTLLDTILVEAGRYGMLVLLTPIVTYDASWPDDMSRPRSGFSSVFSKEAMGLSAAAIAAQTNYLRQLFLRKNSVSGVAYKDDSAIFAIEPINEPRHHPEQPRASIRYIEALCRAVRSTGCRKLIVYNVSQNMEMASILAKTEIDAATFAWYPTGLARGRPVLGNGLLLADDYPQMRDRRLQGKAKVVYEFDAADSMASYMYPAMARAFRGGGAQFAAMFSYDSLPIAADNLEFNDHFLSLIYTPAKAISFLIAGRAFATLPRGAEFGLYPLNMRFGPASVDDLADRSQWVTDEELFYSNDTLDEPPAPEKLAHIAGVGSSPVVSYEGTGAYFLDRVAPGLWHLEVYPDSALVANPFDHSQSKGPISLVVWRERGMRLEIQDLGADFVVEREPGIEHARAADGRISVSPGAYRLRSRRTNLQGSAPGPDPDAMIRSFYVPPMVPFAPVLLHEPPGFLPAGEPWTCRTRYVAERPPDEVTVYHRRSDRSFSRHSMRCDAGFEYHATIPGNELLPGVLDYYICVREGREVRTFPVNARVEPTAWDFPNEHGWRAPILSASAPVMLFDAARDYEKLIVPYGGYRPYEYASLVPGADLNCAALRLDGGDLASLEGGEVVCQLSLLEFPTLRTAFNGARRAIRVVGSAVSRSGRFAVILIERDGSAWGMGTSLELAGDVEVPLAELRRVRAAMLPRDFPVGINPYWLRSPNRADARSIDLESVEALQLCVGTRFLRAGDDPHPVVEIRQVLLV